MTIGIQQGVWRNVRNGVAGLRCSGRLRGEIASSNDANGTLGVSGRNLFGDRSLVHQRQAVLDMLDSWRSPKSWQRMRHSGHERLQELHS